MTLASGINLGRYEIRSKLGAGGMGEVYLAEDQQLRRRVAVKILPAEIASNRDRMRRFTQEAQAAAALNHPNIAHVYEIGSSSIVKDGTSDKELVHFIAMEYVEGETLSRLITNRQTELAKLIRYLQQSAEGLAKAHEAGIVHRDLKPDNIMVTRDGHAKILDFGLAKLIDTPQTISDQISDATTVNLEYQSKPGTILGTVGYMSPEQAMGNVRDIDHRSDIFSFGCILFEAVTGKRAFAGKDALDSLHKTVHAPTPLIKESNANAPDELQRIVRRCLAKDPEERYQNIKDVALELKEVRRDLQEANVSSRATEQHQAESTSTQPIGATTNSSSPSVSSAEFVVSEIKKHKLALIGLVALLTVGIVAVAVYLSKTKKEATIDSIAVLPFINQNEPSEEWLSDGVTESIINSLTQLPNLKVSARNSVFRYKGKNVDPVVAGTELGVRAVLTGRVMQRGDNLLVSTELVDLQDNKQLWGQHYNRKLVDLIGLQEEIAKQISENLRLHLAGDSQKLLTKRSTENNEAYQLYLKGRYFINKRTQEDLRKAIDYFQQAIAKDPNDAIAYTGLSDAYASLAFPLGAVAPNETMPKAKQAAAQALLIDNDLGEAHASFAYVTFFYDWNWETSEREFTRALELKPNNADTHHWNSHFLMSQHRVDESLRESKRALELSPLDLILNIHLGWHYLYAGQYDEALTQFQKVVDMDRNFAQTYVWLGLVYEQLGRYSEAMGAFRKAIELFPGGSTQALAQLGHCYAKSGNKSEALKTLAELQQLAKSRYVSAYHLAAIYAALGDKDQTFAQLNKAFEERSEWLVNIKLDRRFHVVNSDPRFPELVRRIGLP